MSRRKYTGNWIEAYLEWNSADSWAVGSRSRGRSGIGDTGVDTSEEFVAAYLDWSDAGQPLDAFDAHYHPTAVASDPGGIVDPASRLAVFREALQYVLHSQSDRIQLMQRILDAGDVAPRTVKLATEALEQEEQLLEDERREWREWLLTSCSELPQSPTAPRTDVDKYWPRALDDVATDLRALKGTVLALQAGSRAFPHDSDIR